MKQLLLLCLLAITSAGFAAGSEFKLLGKVKRDGNPVSDATVTLFRNTLPDSNFRTDKEGNFLLELDLNQIYLIEIDKPGFYPLKVNISTLLPEKKIKNGVSGEFEIELNMVEALPGLRVDILNNPIVQIKYNKKKDRFDYDEEYFNFIKLELERLYDEADQLAARGITAMPEQKTIKKFEAPYVNIKGKLFSDSKCTKPLTGYPVVLLDKESKEEIQQVKTEEDGSFKFINVRPDRSYIGMVKNNEKEVRVQNVYLATSDGDMIRQLLREEEKFHFVILPSDYQVLTEIYVEDPWVKPYVVEASRELVVTDVINYPSESWSLDNDAYLILDKVSEILKSNPTARLQIVSHTDARGDASFNRKLSEKRAEHCAEYLIKKGFDKNRLTWVGKGEEAPVNYCTDLVECAEHQHKANRRTEFHFTSK